jgi:uncharacterized protein YegP (UPF0339 family)
MLVLKSANGLILMWSESYKTRSNAVRAARAIQKAMSGIQTLSKPR